MVRDTEDSPTVMGHTKRQTRTDQTADKSSKSTKCSIVRPAMRLPKDLCDKMPSAPTTPVSGRKDPVTSKLAAGPVKKVPKTVASMVRR